MYHRSVRVINIGGVNIGINGGGGIRGVARSA